MKIQETSLIEIGDTWIIEITLAEIPDVENATEFVKLRLGVSRERYPRLPAAQTEALAHARNVINDEIQRLEQIRGRELPGEDWRR